MLRMPNCFNMPTSSFLQALYKLMIRCVPHSRSTSCESSASVVAMPRGQPRPLSQREHRMQPSATSSEVPTTTPSAPSAIAFAMS